MTQWPWMVPPILSDGSIEPTMGMPAPAPGAPPGIFERLSGVFGGQQGLLNLGANLMSASGPSQQPVSFGSALGNAIAANQQFQRQNQTDMLQQMLLRTKLQKKSKLQDEYEYAKSQGFKGSIEDWKKIAQQPSAGPASIQEYNLYTEQEKASGRTPMEFDPWLQRRSQLNVGAPYMLGEVAGQRGPFSRVTGEFTPTSTLPQEADARETLAGAEAGGKTTGTGKAQRALDLPAAQARLGSATQKIDFFIRKAGDIAADPSLSRATGLMAYIPSVHGGGAKNVENAIEALKAQIGFQELQDMRANSPTGGALGQVTERELTFLQNSLLSLERSQSPEQYRANLLDIIEYANGMKARLKRAFDQTYPSQNGSAANPQDTPPQKARRYNPQTRKIE